ncbi:WW domain-binding protein [Acrasis kona]|uniref:WW domain-binding protein n=1 Tax=Acrasis kona TaxID=1008807 RepID=A0AAW2Z4B6_9EUKA
MGKDKSKNPADQFRKEEKKREQKKNKAKKEEAVKSTLKTHDKSKLKDELTRLELLLKQDRITDSQRAQRKRIRTILTPVDLKLIDQQTNMLMKQIKQQEKEELEQSNQDQQPTIPTFIPPPPPPGLVLPPGFVIPPPPIPPPSFNKPIFINDDQVNPMSVAMSEEERWTIKTNDEHDPIQERIDAIKKRESQSQVQIPPITVQQQSQYTTDVGPPLPPSLTVNQTTTTTEKEQEQDVGPSLPPSFEHYSDMPSMDDYQNDDSVVGPAMPDISNYYPQYDQNEHDESVTAPYPMMDNYPQTPTPTIHTSKPQLPSTINNNNIPKRKATIAVSNMIPPSMRRNIGVNQNTAPKRDRTGDILLAQHLANQNNQNSIKSSSTSSLSTSIQPKSKKAKVNQEEEFNNFMSEMNNLF